MTLVSRTVRLDALPDLASVMEPVTAFLWIREGEGFAAFGEAARIDPGTGVERFARAEEQLAEVLGAATVGDDVRRPGTGPLAFGSFTFDPDTPGSSLVIPSLVIGRSGDEAWLTVTADASGDASAASSRDGAPPGWVSVDEGAWVGAVTRVRDAIRSGWLEKVVLAREVTVRSAEPFDARRIASALTRAYPSCFTFCFDGLVGASPELLVRRTGGAVGSVVLAGSAARGETAEEDERLGRALLASPKERSEHDLALGTVRDVLSLVCAELKVDDEPSLMRLANVQHLSTVVRGELAGAHGSLALAGRLHPTAAVCGVPTSDALDLIRKTEGFERGRYAGPVGWTDVRGDGEWAIALRCAEISGDTARLFAGAGIVAGSDPSSELIETDLKLRAMRSAMGLA